MVFSSYGNASSCYLPLDSDQGVTFYKNENALFSPQQPPTSSVVCRRNQDNSGAVMQPFGNNSHGTVVVDAVCQDFQPVAHLSSNGYYGYVPPTNAPTAAVNAGTVNVQLDCQTETEADAAMDCGGEMENFQQLQQHQRHLQQQQRKRKEYGDEATATDCKRRKTWLEEEHRQQQQQQAAGFPQSFGWNALPYAHQPQNQMDCHEDAPMMMTGPCNDQTIIAATNNNGCFQIQLAPVIPPVAMVQPQPPKNALLVDSAIHKGGFALGNRCDRRWNIAMPTSRRSPPNSTGCSTGSGHCLGELSEKHQQQSAIIGGGGGQELEDLFVSLHGSGFFLAG